MTSRIIFASLVCLSLIQLSCRTNNGPVGPLPPGQFLSGVVYDHAGHRIPDVGVHYIFEMKSLLKLAKISETCPSTFIGYSVPSPCHVTVTVMRWFTREVLDTLINENQNSGSYRLSLDASSLTNGMYLLQIVFDTKVQESYFANLNTDLTALVHTAPLATTGTYGEFSLPYREFAIGVPVNVTSSNGPVVIDRIAIPPSVQMVLFKEGYETLVQPVVIDTTQDVSIAFTLSQ